MKFMKLKFNMFFNEKALGVDFGCINRGGDGDGNIKALLLEGKEEIGCSNGGSCTKPLWDLSGE